LDRDGPFPFLAHAPVAGGASECGGRSCFLLLAVFFTPAFSCFDFLLPKFFSFVLKKMSQESSKTPYFFLAANPLSKASLK